MITTLVETTFALGEQAIELNVTQSGLTISVAAGSFIYGGQTFNLPQSTFTATNRPQTTDIRGFLVKDKTNGSMLLLVDELVSDGVDVPYDFSVGNYELIALLFACQVPSNSAHLNDVNVTLFLSKERTA